MRRLLSKMRWAPRTLILIATLVLAGAAQAQLRQATLTIRGDVVCQFPAYTDHQIGIDTIEFALPEIDGPVSGQGQYSLQGTGYALAGISASAGEVRDDAELVLTYGQWNYQGTWINAEAPGVPTKAKPVVLPLEPGAQTTVSFQNAMVHQGGSCSGAVIYQIDFKRETQLWQIDLVGGLRSWSRDSYSLIDPLTGKYRDFYFENGFTFDYTLTARVTLERRAGKWQVKAGEVTRAKVTPTYHQDPKMYNITGQFCVGCSQIAAMKGKPLAAGTDGNTLILHWPNHAPEARVTSTLAMQCAPGPRLASCENARKMGSNYTDQDTKFFERARTHRLPLKEGQMKPMVEINDSPAYLERLSYEYYITRVK